MCKEVGFAYMIERDQNSIKIVIDGNTEVYQIMKVEEFTSERKRMSVLVKDQNGQIINFIKGADMAIIPRLNSDF